jgi:peptide/nickel transport system substrate-binding protein
MRRLVAVATASVILVSACGSQEATTTPGASSAPSGSPAASPSPVIPTGGTITMRLGADITSWDPCVIQAATVPGTMGDVLNAVYGSLVYTDVNGAVQPAMAESLTTDDAITWTFKLHDGVKFTDGSPYDAEAVKFNFDRAADEPTHAPARSGSQPGSRSPSSTAHRGGQTPVGRR